MTQPSLILFPVPIGADDVDISLPPYNKAMLNTCHHFIVEELRTARRNLKRMGYEYPIDDTQFYELNEHTSELEIEHYLDPIAQGCNIGLMSEAGLPCVADPGALITRMAQRRGISIIPLVGPSSIMMGLMASGFNGQNFAFIGYLPIDKTKRQSTLKILEQRIYREHQTQILIEAPYRNNQLLAELAATLLPTTRICVACDISLPSQYIVTRPARQWLADAPNLHKRNTVFLLYQ